MIMPLCSTTMVRWASIRAGGSLVMRPRQVVESCKTIKVADVPAKPAGTYQIRSHLQHLNYPSALSFTIRHTDLSLYYSLKMQLAFNTILLMSVASGVMALPSTAPNSTYVELYREKTSNGSLVYLGPAQGSGLVRKEVTRLEERAPCSANPLITCSENHTARNNLCDQLVTELFADSSIPINLMPRQICFEAEAANNFCCVSWSKPVANLNKGDLADSANSIMQKCTANGISGKMENTALFGVCATVCLSDRGTGCA